MRKHPRMSAFRIVQLISVIGPSVMMGCGRGVQRCSAIGAGSTITIDVRRVLADVRGPVRVHLCVEPPVMQGRSETVGNSTLSTSTTPRSTTRGPCSSHSRSRADPGKRSMPERRTSSCRGRNRTARAALRRSTRLPSLRPPEAASDLVDRFAEGSTLPIRASAFPAQLLPTEARRYVVVDQTAPLHE